MWVDIESNEIVTAVQLRQEYEEKIRSGEIEQSEQSFEDYIRNCKTENNGTLEDYPVPFN